MTQSEPAKPELGKRAPAFSATDHTGKQHSLEALAGSWVLLYFYPKDNTPGCTTQACGLRDAFDEVQREGLVVLGVSADSSKSHKNFAEKYKLPFPLLVDTDKKIIKSYGVDGVFFPKRTSFLIDSQGKIAKIYDQVQVNDHARQVLVDLKSLRGKVNK